MDTPNGTYADYTVVPANTAYHLPDQVSFEEGATATLALYTAAVALWRNLGLRMPGQRGDEAAQLEKETVVINGASGAVGSFAVQLAKASPGVGKVIAIAGSSRKTVEEVGADVVLDYRSASIADDLKSALGGEKVKYIFDCANSATSVAYLTPSFAQGARYTSVTPTRKLPMYPDGDEQKAMLEKAEAWFEQVWVGSVHDDKPSDGKLFGAIASRIFEWLFAEGKLRGHPYTVLGGLEKVDEGLATLKGRKGGDNRKLVYRVQEP
jgi:NADPH:quinone reductase